MLLISLKGDLLTICNELICLTPLCLSRIDVYDYELGTDPTTQELIAIRPGVKFDTQDENYESDAVAYDQLEKELCSVKVTTSTNDEVKERVPKKIQEIVTENIKEATPEKNKSKLDVQPTKIQEITPEKTMCNKEVQADIQEIVQEKGISKSDFRQTEIQEMPPDKTTSIKVSQQANILEKTQEKETSNNHLRQSEDPTSSKDNCEQPKDVQQHPAAQFLPNQKDIDNEAELSQKNVQVSSSDKRGDSRDSQKREDERKVLKLTFVYRTEEQHYSKKARMLDKENISAYYHSGDGCLIKEKLYDSLNGDSNRPLTSSQGNMRRHASNQKGRTPQQKSSNYPDPYFVKNSANAFITSPIENDNTHKRGKEGASGRSHLRLSTGNHSDLDELSSTKGHRKTNTDELTDSSFVFSDRQNSSEKKPGNKPAALFKMQLYGIERTALMEKTYTKQQFPGDIRQFSVETQRKTNYGTLNVNHRLKAKQRKNLDATAAVLSPNTTLNPRTNPLPNKDSSRTRFRSPSQSNSISKMVLALDEKSRKLATPVRMGRPSSSSSTGSCGQFNNSKLSNKDSFSRQKIKNKHHMNHSVRIDVINWRVKREKPSRSRLLKKELLNRRDFHSSNKTPTEVGMIEEDLKASSRAKRPNRSVKQLLFENDSVENQPSLQRKGMLVSEIKDQRYLISLEFM